MALRCKSFYATSQCMCFTMYLQLEKQTSSMANLA